MYLLGGRGDGDDGTVAWPFCTLYQGYEPCSFATDHPKHITRPKVEPRLRHQLATCPTLGFTYLHEIQYRRRGRWRQSVFRDKHMSLSSGVPAAGILAVVHPSPSASRALNTCQRCFQETSLSECDLHDESTLPSSYGGRRHASVHDVGILIPLPNTTQRLARPRSRNAGTGLENSMFEPEKLGSSQHPPHGLMMVHTMHACRALTACSQSPSPTRRGGHNITPC